MPQVLVDALTKKTVLWDAEFEWPSEDVLVVRRGYPFVQEIVDIAESAPEEAWRDSSVIGESDVAGGALAEEYPDAVQRSSSSLCLTYRDRDEDIATLGQVGADHMDRLKGEASVLMAVEGHIVLNYMHKNRHAVVSQSSAYELLRYRKGQAFGEHVDTVRGHPTLSQRRLSIIAFANEDFSGGELVFPRQGLTIKPEAGMVVVFPSGITHPHEAKPVIEGTRYAIVAWLY